MVPFIISIYDFEMDGREKEWKRELMEVKKESGEESVP
jgi:hypothetical protein